MVLPFPFDQVEQFFLDLFNDISRAVAGVVSAVTAGVANIINPLRDFITQQFMAFRSALFGQLQFLKDELLGILSGVPGAVAGVLGGIQNAVAPIIATLNATVQGVFTDLQVFITGTMFPFLQNLGRNITNGLAAVQGTISAAITPLISQIQQATSQIFQQVNTLPVTVWNQLTEWGTALQQQLAGVGQALGQQGSNTFGAVTALFTPIEDLRNDFNNLVRDTTAGFAMFAQELGDVFSPLFTLFNNAVGSFKTEFIDPFLESMTSLPGQIQQIIQPTGSITPEDARAEITQAGSIVLASYAAVNSLAAIGEFVSLGQYDEVFRGAIDTMDDIGLDVYATDLITFDYETGVKPALAREVLRRYQPNIPGPGDLVNMLVKEAFVEELRTPAPEQFITFMAEQGFSRFWSDTFWTAHWKPIDLQVITEMFHRGIIPEEDFIRRLILLDFRPDDTELIKQVLFNLPNRIEARLMARFGLLSDEQLDEIIKASGVREDFVEPLRVMMQDFNLTNIFTRQESATVSAYEKGLINEEQARQLLQQVKRPPNVIDADIILMNLKRNLEFQEDQMKIIERAAKRGNITPSRALELFQEIGIDSEIAAQKVAIIDFEIDISTTQEVKQAAPKLTPTQIVNAMRNGLITLDAALSALQAKGFTADEAQILMELKEEPEVSRLTPTQIVNAIENGIITEADGIQQLKAKNFTQADIDVLLALGIKAEETKLTASQIINAAQKGIITFENALTLLQSKGFDIAEIEILVALKGEIDPTKLTPTQIAKAVKQQLLTPGQGIAVLIEKGFTQEDAQLLLEIQGSLEAE